MFDASLRRPIDRLLARSEKLLALLPLSANSVTWCGLSLCLPLLWCLAHGMFSWALLLIVLNRVFDGIDGAIARLRGATDLGGYWDIVADFLFYASIPVGFALYDVQNALASTLLLASFIGTSSSFLAYAIIASKRQMTTEARGKKSFYHLGGLIEGSETIVFMLLICLIPAYYNILAMIFAGLCALSTGGRMLMAYQDFRD